MIPGGGGLVPGAWCLVTSCSRPVHTARWRLELEDGGHGRGWQRRGLASPASPPGNRGRVAAEADGGDGEQVTAWRMAAHHLITTR